MSAVTAKHINDCFRGKIYGSYDIFTPRSFRDFVLRNDIDLSRALTADVDGVHAGSIVFAQRGPRAWFALMGILPEYRQRGIATSLLIRGIDALRSNGARSIEFEVVQRNGPIAATYKGFGFELQDELLVWARRARKRPAAKLRFRPWSESEVAAIARRPSTCWQREPRSVAAAERSALIACDGAYAFVRMRGENAVILDAGARDESSAGALLDEIERSVSADITFVNEPKGSPLSLALSQARWKNIDRQYRMMRRY